MRKREVNRLIYRDLQNTNLKSLRMLSTWSNSLKVPKSGSNNNCYYNIGKITIFKGYKKLFRILMVAIIFSPTVYNIMSLATRLQKTRPKWGSLIWDKITFSVLGFCFN